MNQCFVKRGKTIKGPFSFEKIQQLLADKKLSKSDLAGPSNIGPWQKLATILAQDRAGESFSESAFHDSEAFNFNGGVASEEPDYTQFSPKLPPRMKKKKEKAIQNPESPQPVMSEAQYYDTKRAALDALPGMSQGVGGGSTGAVIIGAILSGILSSLCCGVFAIVPMAFMGLRVYMVRENTSALIIYIAVGLFFSLGGFFFWFFLVSLMSVGASM
jgi:hypothetical protein